MIYEALNNPVRLRTFFVIKDKPGITFNEIARAVSAKRALVAYHLGMLKVGGLVSFAYERKGQASSSYNLTEEGRRVSKELSSETHRS